jgi:hypothetical protein
MHDRLRCARVQILDTARHILTETALGAPREWLHLPVQVCSQVAVRRVFHNLRFGDGSIHTI